MNRLHTFAFNAFSEQTYLLDHGNGEATVFDPGMSSPQERVEFEETCDKLGLVVVQCLLTHAHLDHVMGTAWIYGMVVVRGYILRMNRLGYKPRFLQNFMGFLWMNFLLEVRI